MRDIKYIIKRIIIGTGIALAIMFVKQNVYAYEWETSSDVAIDTSSYQFISNIQVSIGRYPVSGSLQCPSNNNYPITSMPTNINADFSIGTNSGDYLSTSGILNSRTQILAMYHDRWYVTFGTYQFQPNTLYKVIIPLAYNSNIFTDLTSNVNENKLLDENIYSFNDENFDVYSASYSFNTVNDIEENNSTYPTYMYFSVLFSTTATNQNSVTLYINGSSDITHSITAYNTISDSNYLFKPNWNRTTCATSFYGQYSNRFYKPFLYTTSTSSDDWYVDGNDIISDSTTSIKDQIGNIVDGVFDDDLDFPYMNGGGRTFGDNQYTLTDLLIMPINFLRTFVNSSDTCEPVQIPLPAINGNFTLPCLQTFAVSFVGQRIVDLIKLIAGCTISFKILTKVYNLLQRLLDPERVEPLQDIF